jgi:hypothetical protein
MTSERKSKWGHLTLAAPKDNRHAEILKSLGGRWARGPGSFCITEIRREKAAALHSAGAVAVRVPLGWRYAMPDGRVVKLHEARKYSLTGRGGGV